jgi:hypothetical protein
MVPTGPNFSDNAEWGGMIWVYIHFPLAFLTVTVVAVRIWWRAIHQKMRISASDWCVVGALVRLPLTS